MRLWGDRILPILERVKADLIVVYDDPLAAEEADDLLMRLAAVGRTTSAFYQLYVELARLIRIEVAVNLEALLVHAEELLLVHFGVDLRVGMGLEKVSSALVFQVA